MPTEDDASYARPMYAAQFGIGVLAWPGIIKGLRIAQQTDLDDLLDRARGEEFDELRNLLARAWAAGWVAGWDDRSPGGRITPNPFDEGWH